AQQNEIIKTLVVHNQVIQIALFKQLENFENEYIQASNDLKRFKDKNYKTSNKNDLSNLK
ncbi:6997_t:CDS:1, partial [Gigaspora rosea]